MEVYNDLGWTCPDCGKEHGPCVRCDCGAFSPFASEDDKEKLGRIGRILGAAAKLALKSLGHERRTPC